MNRLLVGAVVVLLAAAGTGAWYVLARDDGDSDGVRLRGSVALIDREMIYEGGTPVSYSEGSIDNGCSSKYLNIGTEVIVYDFQRREVARGTVVSTHHWARSTRTGMVGDINDHGCLFTYMIEGVPELPEYDVVIPFVMDLRGVRQGELEAIDLSGVEYLDLPLQHIEITD